MDLTKQRREKVMSHPELSDDTDLNLLEKYSKEGPYNYDDGAFALWLSRFGLWKSTNSEGKGICSGENKEDVIFWSREHLNGFQNSVSYVTGISSDVGGKL